MIKFKEHDGMLFKMLDKPVPLTPDAEMPCIIAPIQDDSPMGRYVKQCWGHDKVFMREYAICGINADIAAKIGVARDTPVSIHMFEIIGTHVKEGSDKWALHQMMQGYKVRHKSYSMPKVHCAMNEKCQIAIFTTPSSMIDGGDVICHANDWLTSRQVDAMIDERTGWQIYKEPKEEPKLPKEPIANCENCKHVCTNSNIDHCHMYEPKHESENIIHWHIPADMNLKYFHLHEFKVGDWVEIESAHTKGKTFVSMIKEIPNQEHYTVHVNSYFGGHTIYGVMERQIVRKLKPSEIVVTIGCLSGTVKDLSYVEVGRFWFIGKKTERCPGGMHAILYEEMLDAPTRELVEGLLKAQEEE